MLLMGLMMIKYRVHNDRGFIETTDVDFARQMNNGTLAGVEVIEFTLATSETIDKRAMYQAECDHITAEIMRRKLIGDLSEAEEIILIKKLTEKSNEIKNNYI